MTDLELAIAHHILVFTLVAIVAAEYAVVRPGFGGAALARTAHLDAGYGIVALLIVAVGIARINYGYKGSEFYHGNPWFWAKMTAFVVMGLLSVMPTIAFIKWRRAAKTNPAFTPAEPALARVRAYIAAELALVPVILICAAAMARYGGF